MHAKGVLTALIHIEHGRRLKSVRSRREPREAGAHRPRTTLIVELSGEIDLANVTEVFTALTADLSPQRRHLVVDARSVTFLDSTGIDMFLRTLEAVRAVGGSLHIVANQSAVCRVFALLGLTGHLGCLPSMEAALACAEQHCVPAARQRWSARSSRRA